MIHINRSPTPECLLENGTSDGSLETQRAIHHYTSGRTKEFEFEVYKNVKEELKIMFSGKCAYCESKITHVEYGHVEHYRPKGYIEGNPGSPGYYWLGSKWDNLLLACEICNGKQYKGNHFPLKDPIKRAKRHLDNIYNEEPLLINPCEEEHPEDYFIFRDTGEIEGRSLKGLKSIEYYGLYRKDLIEERARHINDLNLLLMSLESHIISYDRDKCISTENAIRRIISEFKLKRDKSAQFAGLTRQYLDEKLYDILFRQSHTPIT